MIFFFEFLEKPPPLVYWKWCAYKVLWSKSAARSGVPIKSYTRKIAKIRSYARKWGGIIVTPPCKTNHSKIHEIRPITPKSDWSYNHPLL